VEGCHGAGRPLAQRLVANGELVLGVPAKLAGLDGTGVTAVAREDATVSLRLLCDPRGELGALRTQAVCRLHRLLAELTPGDAPGADGE
jgi:transposase